MATQTVRFSSLPKQRRLSSSHSTFFCSCLVSSQQVYIVPRWGGGPSSDWYPWLIEALKAEHPQVSCHVIDMPEPGTPKIENWVGHLKKVLPAQSENVFIVGHSVGNQAILRYLSEIDDNVVGKYGGVLHVAGWFFVDKEKEWPTLLPWLAPFDTDRASKRANNFHLVISDNDQFTSDYQGTKKAFEDHVGAKVQVIPGAKHFNEAIEPTVQSLILSMLFG